MYHITWEDDEEDTYFYLSGIYFHKGSWRPSWVKRSAQAKPYEDRNQAVDDWDALVKLGYRGSDIQIIENRIYQ